MMRSYNMLEDWLHFCAVKINIWRQAASTARIWRGGGTFSSWKTVLDTVRGLHVVHIHYTIVRMERGGGKLQSTCCLFYIQLPRSAPMLTALVFFLLQALSRDATYFSHIHNENRLFRAREKCNSNFCEIEMSQSCITVSPKQIKNKSPIYKCDERMCEMLFCGSRWCKFREWGKTDGCCKSTVLERIKLCAMRASCSNPSHATLRSVRMLRGAQITRSENM